MENKSGKKSFILYYDSEHFFTILQDIEAGRLIKDIFNYEKNGVLPNYNEDRLLKMAFESIKTYLDDAKQKYIKVCEQNKINGRKGGRPKNKNPKNPNGYFGNPKKAKKADTDNDTDNDTDKNIYINIINYLNEKANTNYKISSNKTKRLIKARLNENFNEYDFYKVIDNKCNVWLNTDMNKYLRPETLFGTKFESYLNENIKNNDFNEEELSPEVRKWLDE